MNRFENKPVIYVAGQLTNEHPLGYIRNIALMENNVLELWKLGYVCYSPCEDFLRFLIAFSHGVDVNSEDVYNNSLGMLLKCDVVYLPRDVTISSGVAKELELASEHFIPVIRDLENLDKMVKVNGKWVLNNWE